MEDTNKQIFQEICKLTTSQDFQEASFSYIQLHKSKFEDTEENKLEYTAIHEGYIHILEQYIEIQLKDTYSEDQVAAFYDNFKANFQTYKDINIDVVDTLWDFLDFNKFKATCLSFSKDDGSRKPGDENKVLNTDMDEKLFLDLEKQDVNDPSNKWTLKLDATDEKQGIKYKMWSQPQADGLLMLRVTFLIKDVTMNQYKAMFTNVEDAMKDQEQYIKEFDVLERHPDGSLKLYYMKQKLTGMSEREMVGRNDTMPQKDGTLLNINCSTTHPKYPENDKIIRMEIYKATRGWATDEGIEMLQFSNFNMKGWFPMRLINMMMGSIIKGQIPKIVDSFKKWPK